MSASRPQATLTESFPRRAELALLESVREHGGVRISGGYGSALSSDPSNPSHDGKLLDYDPNGIDADRLVARVLRRRWPNRGMEGLCITPDGKTLVGIMESPLDNPAKELRKTSRTVRLLFLEIATGATRQYLYILDVPGIGASDIAALTSTRFLVIERDKKRPGDPEKPSGVKRIYQADVADASDVSDAADGPAGLLVEGGTLEQLGEELRAAGIRAATKSLVLDLLATPGGYPHDKPEGLVPIGSRLLVNSNDNDFGIDDDGKGGIVPKQLPAAYNAVDRTKVYFIRLDQPLL